MAGLVLSTGAINSIIDTYKPDDFFQKGGVITIVYECVIVATINVYHNNSDSEHFFEGNNNKYLIQGSDTSLRRLNRLCNLDIANKWNYLRFDGSPAVVPDDLASEESGNSFFVTPKRDKDVFREGTKYFKRFHQFDDMLDALEKEDPGSSYLEPDVKTVYVLVSMHGEDKNNKLQKTIKNKVHILPSGLCSAPLETPSEQLIRLEQLRGTHPDLIEETYERGSRLRIDALKKNVENSLASGEHFGTLISELTPEQIPKRIAQYGELEKLHVGPLLQDREYTHDSEALVFSEFISIIGSNWKQEEMMTPYGTFSADKELSSKINTYFAPFKKPHVTQKEAADEFQKIQSVNLLNIAVLEKITTTMNGINIPFERFTGLIGEVDNLTTSTAGTGIPHYTNVRLTHLLGLFEKLGFNKVVLFDEGCRTGNMYTTSSRAGTEKAAVVADYGGKRTKRTKRRTRRRSRRFHKKS